MSTSARCGLASIALAWLSPLAIHQLVTPKKEVVALAAAIWLPGLLIATLADRPSERWGREVTEHPFAPFALLYAVAAAYGLVWALARGNDIVLAGGQTFTAALFLLGFAVAGPMLARHATSEFWLLFMGAVAVLSLPGIVPVLRGMLGADAQFSRFIDPVAVLAPICLLITLVLVYPRRPALGALGAGYFAFLTLLTFTRSYWIGATGALLFLAFATARGRKRAPVGDRRRWIRTAVPAVALMACAAAVLLATPIGGFVSDRLALDPGQSKDLSLVVREHELASALAHLRADPVTGLGSGGEYLSLYQTSATTMRFGATNFVHNAYVYFPLKFGLLGFAALAGLLLGTIRVVGFALSERSRHAAGRVLFTAVLLFILLASVTAPNLVDPKYSLLSGAVAWLAGAPSRGQR